MLGDLAHPGGHVATAGRLHRERLAGANGDDVDEAEEVLAYPLVRVEVLDADGRAVRVCNPGRLNGGPGPDFRDAIIEIDGAELRGDVELHVRASAFRSHGHHLDRAYNNLALHVVYLADDGSRTLLRPDGKLVTVYYFNSQDDPTQYYGGVRHIAATIWEI